MTIPHIVTPIPSATTSWGRENQQFRFASILICSRLVDAPNEDEAELTAVELIRKDNWLREAVRNDRRYPPMIFADEIEEISTFDSPGAGFTFYEEELTAA